MWGKLIIGFGYIVFVFSIPLMAQKEADTTKLLSVERLEFSTNNFNSNPSVPDFADYSREFKFGHRFSTAQFTNISPIDSFNAKSTYTGFQINFIFNSTLFRDSLSRARNKLTFAFEAGRSTSNLYEVVVNGVSGYSYNFKSDIFRMSLGYKYYISKKRKFRLYTGAELINEFNISAGVFENQFGDLLGQNTGERKLFAKKSYNVYVNVPFGFDWRAFKKASIFFHLNFALGLENLDPIRKINFYSGSRLGVSLSI